MCSVFILLSVRFSFKYVYIGGGSSGPPVGGPDMNHTGSIASDRTQRTRARLLDKLNKRKPQPPDVSHKHTPGCAQQQRSTVVSNGTLHPPIIHYLCVFNYSCVR